MKKNLPSRRWPHYLLILIGVQTATPNYITCHTEPITENRSNIDRRDSKFYILQQLSVTGKVTFEGMPLSGVTVSIKGKSAVSITDDYGDYSIAADIYDTLIFSYTGFKTYERAVNGNTIVNAAMQEDMNSLDEVTINAGYYRVKDKERTGNISKIVAADIERQPVTNLLATMQGRMAGVNITQNSGLAGGGFTVQIRGQNSIRADGNEPLYVIDGVPYSSEPIGNGLSMTIMPSLTSPLNNINPADIESIEVLKDADATAIYGSRGANGVILISTKKGKKGKTSISATVSQGTGSVAHFMDLMNTEQYLAMRAEAFANDGITEYPQSAYDINGSWDPDRNTDWQEKFLGGMSKITNVNASVSGGSDQMQFLIRSNFARETTVFPGDFEYKKYGMHVNLSHSSFSNRFKVSFSGGYNIQNNYLPGADLSIAAWTLAPNAPALYDEEGNLNWADNTFENPLARLESRSKSKTHDLVASSIISYEVLPRLDAKVSLGYTDLDHHENTVSPSTMYNPSFGLGSDSSSIMYTDTARKSWIAEPQLTWRPNLGLIGTDFLVGATFQEQKNKLLGMGGFGFSSNSMIHNPAAAMSSEVMTFDESVYKYQSLFGRANFNYDSKYIVNLTGRRDGSSRFGPGRRFAWFGAVGAAWLFHKESLFKDSNILSFGKLRGSYGTAGNDQIGNYRYLNTYMAGSTQYEGITGLQPSRLYNADFGWETNRKLELAVETGFLRDRIFFTAAWYRNRSSDQLVGVPLPGATGFTQIQSNLDAVVENSGIELTLHTVNVSSENFKWTTDLNFSTAKNKLISFPNLESSVYSNRYIVGLPLNIQRVYKYTGIDPDTGIYTFEDVNGDGMLTVADDKTSAKDLNPSFFGGLQNHLQYKGWTLDFLFQFVKQLNYNIPATLGVPGTMSNQPAMVSIRWQEAGDAAQFQQFTSGQNGAAVQAFYNYASSDAAITDASYVRLKNLALGYQFPKSWTGSVSCKATLEGQNLLTFTKYEGPDPEFKGIGYLPPLRIITAGLQFNF